MILPRVVEFGPFTVHLYGVTIAIAIFIGWYIAKKRASKYKVPLVLFDDPILLLPLFLAIVGARTYHVIDYWDLYSKNLPSILGVQNGGLGIWGALVGIFVGFWLIAMLKKINLLSLLDLAAPSVILAQAIGRIGNWINQEGFGPPTNLPWAVYINPENRPTQYISASHFHPTFFYEAIIDAIFFLLLLKLSQKFKKPGQAFALYLILYSIGRFTVEFFRIDTATVGTIKLAHILAISTFILGILMFWKIQVKHQA